MIMLEKLKFIFCRRNQKILVHSKSFKECVENEIGKTIKTLCTDCGGEYCSKEFEVFCDAHGIQR